MTDNWASGRVALVTGATSGFGEAMTRRLLTAGAHVIATGRRADRLDALATELATARLLTRALDVRDQTSIDAMLAHLPAPFDAIDILFNNAGLALGLSKAHEADLDDWQTMIDTNVSGLVRINMSSVAASYPYPGGNVYGATKAFVRQFSLNLRSDLLGTKIRVTSIEPGMADTEFSVVRFNGDKTSADKVYQGVHAMSADDVALVCEGVLKLPAHININSLELMPVQQAFGPFAVNRD